MKNIYNDITTTIDYTPLVRLNKLSPNFSGSILLKLEFMNPGSSIKDRIALNMIKDAISKNKINQDTVLIEPTSGNTGVGLAMVAAAFGIKLVLTMPETMSIERRKLLKAYGAELILTSGSAGMVGAVEKAHELAAMHANYLLLQQFENEANSDSHRQTTAEEIWCDTDGEIDILVAGVGTGGTITGVSEVIKKRKPFFKAIAVEPSSSPTLSAGIAGPHKIQGIGAGFIPKILNREIIDEVVTITDVEAGNAARNVAKQEGILVGISGGAAIAAALKVACNPDNQGKMIVVIIPSNGDLPCIPSTNDILFLINEFRKLIFSDFFNQQILQLKNSQKSIQCFLRNLQRMLQQHVFNVMLYENTTKLISLKQLKEQAHAHSICLLKQIPNIRLLLDSDAQAAYEGDPACETPYLPILCYPGMLSITYHRIAHELYKYKIPLLPRIISELAHNQTGIDIHPGAEISDGFFIDHGTGVVIGETTHIGRHVTIYHGVTLGAKNFPTDQNGKIIKGIKRHPIIGNNVTIYSNAVILGCIHIGDNSVIGGNVCLTNSVAPNSRIYQKKSSVEIFTNGDGI